jgi:hypothetical protein
MTNISSAFRVRNRLKEKIQYLNGLIGKAVYQKTVGAEENRAGLDGKNLQDAIACSVSLMDLLCEFNKAIEKANAVNRDILITLESLKAKIALYEQVAGKCRDFKGYEYEYPETRKGDWSGEMVKVVKEPLIDQKAVVEALNALKKEKNALEDKLSRSNGEVTVDFDVDRVLAVL